MIKKQVNLRLNPGTIKMIKEIQTHLLIHEEFSKSQADVVEEAVKEFHSRMFADDNQEEVEDRWNIQIYSCSG